MRVRACSPASRAPPKSVSLATAPSRRRPARGGSGTSTLWGLTSRWITPRAWACARASASATPISSVSRSSTASLAISSASVSPWTSSGDQVEGVVLGAGLVQRDDRRVRETGGRQRLSARPTGVPGPLCGIRLSATSRCSSSSRARHTTPKPPSPRRSSRRYRPRTSAEGRPARRSRSRSPPPPAFGVPIPPPARRLQGYGR